MNLTFSILLIISLIKIKLMSYCQIWAVNTTGNKDLDAIKTNCIALDVVNLSRVILKPKSSLLVKIFSGKDENILIKNAKDSFKKIERIKPDSSRKESREMYLLCSDLKTI